MFSRGFDRILIGGVTGLMGLGMIASGYFLLKTDLEFSAAKVVTTAEIVSVDYEGPQRGGRALTNSTEVSGAYYPTVAFTDQNGVEQVRRTTQGYSDMPHAPGDRVEIAYVPEPGGRTRLSEDGNAWLGFLFFLVVGLPFTVVGAKYLWSGINRHRGDPAIFPDLDTLTGTRRADSDVPQFSSRDELMDELERERGRGNGRRSPPRS